MKVKPVVITLALLLLLGGVCFAFSYRAIEDPTYKGKRYSEWLYGTGQNRREALKGIGAEAAPFLMHEFEARDSLLKVKLLAVLPQKTKDMLGLRPANVRRSRSFCAFVGIANQAECAVPSLCKLLEDPDPDLARRAASALGYMGEAAEPAVPLMTDLLPEADPILEKQLRRSLGRIERSVRRDG